VVDHQDAGLSDPVVKIISSKPHEASRSKSNSSSRPARNKTSPHYFLLVITQNSKRRHTCYLHRRKPGTKSRGLAPEGSSIGGAGGMMPLFR
jgi:hypothetical protein